MNEQKDRALPAFLVLPMITSLLLIWSDNKHKRRMHFVNCSRCSAATATRLVYYRRTVHKKQFIDYWYNIFEMSFFYSMTWLHFFTNNFWKTSFLSSWRQEWDFWCQKISNEQKGLEPEKIVSTDVIFSNFSCMFLNPNIFFKF